MYSAVTLIFFYDTCKHVLSFYIYSLYLPVILTVIRIYLEFKKQTDANFTPCRIPPSSDRPIYGWQRISPSTSERQDEEEKSLRRQGAGNHHAGAGIQRTGASRIQPGRYGLPALPRQHGPPRHQIGRASCRERV